MKRQIVVVVIAIVVLVFSVSGVLADQDCVEITVRKGATLWGIAKDFDMNVLELMSINQLESSRIYPDQKLKVMPYPDNTAIVSWYGKKFDGQTMANGKEFDMDDPSVVAHKWLPFGTKVRLTRKGKSIVVVVQDRGPYVKNRSFDLSRAAATKLGIKNTGVAECQVEILS